MWFLAICLVAIDKRGVAALTLTRELGVAYHTARLFYHKIQQAMADRNAQYKPGCSMTPILAVSSTDRANAERIRIRWWRTSVWMLWVPPLVF